LLLPEEVTHAQVSYTKRKDAAEGNFHDLVNGLGAAAGSRVKESDLQEIVYFHDLRNTLYHHGNGITIPTEKANRYAELAVELLKALLDVDLSSQLLRPEIEARQLDRIKELRSKIDEQEEAFSNAQNQLDLIVLEAIEKIEPKLALPSFNRQFTSIRDKYIENYIDYDGAHQMLSEDPGKQMQFVKELIQLIDSVIADSKIKSKLFTLKEYPYYGGSGMIESVAQNMLTSWPESSELFLRILDLVVAPASISWLDEYIYAHEFGVGNYLPREQDETEEEYLQKILDMGEQSLKSLNDTILTIKKWVDET
jgi:hypothetical protein